jgi:hypothetical protein
VTWASDPSSKERKWSAARVTGSISTDRPKFLTVEHHTTHLTFLDLLIVCHCCRFAIWVIRHRPVTAEPRVHSCANSMWNLWCMFWSTTQVFLLIYFVFYLPITIPPLLHTHLLPCNSPDQEAHLLPCNSPDQEAHLLSCNSPDQEAHLLPCNSPDQEAHFHISGIQADDFSYNRHLVGHTVRDFYLNVRQSTRIDLHDKWEFAVAAIQDLLFWVTKKCSLVDG